MYAKVGRGRNSSGVPITDRQGRAIGRIVGREYHKIVAKRDQMLRSPPGFGFDAWAMEQLVLPRVDRFVVTCKFDGRTYTADVDTFRRYRMEIDRGAGPQYVLPLGYWQEQGASPPVAPERAPAAPAPPPTPTSAPTAPVQGRLL